MPDLSRRLFLTGAAAFIAAPAIVRVASLMPISVQPAIMAPPTFTMHQELEFRWFADVVGSMARQKVAEATGYTFIDERAVILNSAGLSCTSTPSAKRVSGGQVMRLAYITREAYMDRQATKQAKVDEIDRNIPMRRFT